MSIYNAMQSGVSGLKANATRMSSLGNNIANANTVGYKRQFADLVSMNASGPSSKGLSATTVRTVGRMDMDTQGTMMTTDVPTDLAVVGSGFFVVGLDTEANVNSSGHRLTRAGSFRVNEDGYLQNSAGQYLYGYEYDQNGDLGVVDRGSFRDLVPVNLAEVSIQGNPSSEIKYNANLPAQQTGLPTPPDPFLTSVEYYTPLGEAKRLEFSWQPGAAENEWTLTISDEDGSDYGQVDVSFNDSGANAGSPASYDNITDLSAAPASFNFDAATGRATIEIDNGDVPQEIEIDFGAPGSSDRLTQFAGDYSPEGIRKDGAPSAPLNRIEVTDDGVMWGIFGDGGRRKLFDIPIAEVANPEGLSEADGNAFTLTGQSGTLSLRQGGGEKGYIASGMLERSNVDLAEELTQLIEVQRSYSSNAKVVQTSDEMLDETTRLKR